MSFTTYVYWEQSKDKFKNIEAQILTFSGRFHEGVMTFLTPENEPASPRILVNIGHWEFLEIFLIFQGFSKFFLDFCDFSAINPSFLHTTSVL